MLPPRLHAAALPRHRVIGLLGGSFDPAHEGHRYIAMEALRRLHLDAVWWVVTPGNPLKGGTTVTPLARRMESAAAMANHPRMAVTDLEVKLGTRFTADTITALRKLYPTTRFVWLMGEDNLASFHRWQRWRDIVRQVPVAVFCRPPFLGRARYARAARIMARWHVDAARLPEAIAEGRPGWSFIMLRPHPASSTALRTPAAPEIASKGDAAVASGAKMKQKKG